LRSGAFEGRLVKCGVQSRSGCIQEATRFAVNLKQASYLLRQVRIYAASFGDVGFPLLRRQFADGVKEKFASFSLIC
jgi:hypothetical protein